MDFPFRLAWAMRAAGFRSQEALAQAAGLSQPAVHRLLKGRTSRGPRDDTARRLARACEVPYDWLMHGGSQTPRLDSELTEREVDWLRLLAYLEREDIAEFTGLIRERQARNRQRLARDASQPSPAPDAG